MSFNAIIEAEKEAETLINNAKDKAKQIVAEALIEQEKAITSAKNSGEIKLKTDLEIFRNKLTQTIETERKKAEEQLKIQEQNFLKQKNLALKQIIANFK